MKNRERGLLSIGPAPHAHTSLSSPQMMFVVAGCLMPLAIWSIWVFGIKAALTLAYAVSASVLAEALLGLSKRMLLPRDGSALVTGLMVGLSLPPLVPYYVPIAASLFAVLVVKATFGGLGRNWMNPAMGGIVFSWLSWPHAFAQFSLPRTVSGLVGISGPTPLAIAREAGNVTGSIAETFAASGIAVSGFSVDLARFLDSTIFSPFGFSLPPAYLDLFFGNKAGSLGEVSVALILMGAMFLVSARVIKSEIPAFILGTVMILQYVFGGVFSGFGLFEGDVMLFLFSGSIVFSAFFVATDPVTSPQTLPGSALYGIFVGGVVFLTRNLGWYTEGTAFAILAGNCLVPTIDDMVRQIASGKRRRMA